MADGAIVFALANPDPEIDPDIARTVAERHPGLISRRRAPD
jgi:malic enzyme